MSDQYESFIKSHWEWHSDDEDRPWCSCWGFDDCDPGEVDVRCRLQEQKGPIYL